MSSTPAGSATSSAPSITSTANTAGPNLASSSSLYSTLILLLSISAAIISRSLIIRQRHRRLVQQAILDGTYVPGIFPPPLDASTRRFGGGTARREIGEKPGFFEARIVNNGSGSKGLFGTDSELGEKTIGAWSSIIPVSACLVPVDSPITKSTSSPSSMFTSGSPPAQPDSPAIPSRRTLLGRLLHGRSRSTPMQAEEGTLSSSQAVELPSYPSPAHLGLSLPPTQSTSIQNTGSPSTAPEQPAPTTGPLSLTFLVVMPHPRPHSHPVSHERPYSTSSTSSYVSDLKGKDIEATHVERASEDTVTQRDEELPVVEFGLIQVGVNRDVGAS